MFGIYDHPATDFFCRNCGSQIPWSKDGPEVCTCLAPLCNTCWSEIGLCSRCAAAEKAKEKAAPEDEAKQKGDE